MTQGKYIDRDKIKKLIEEGLGNMVICQRLGCSSNTVSYIRAELAGRCVCRGYYQPRHCPVHGDKSDKN